MEKFGEMVISIVVSMPVFDMNPPSPGNDFQERGERENAQFR